MHNIFNRSRGTSNTIKIFNGFILSKCKEKAEAVCVLNEESHHIRAFGGVEFLFHAFLTAGLDKGHDVKRKGPATGRVGPRGSG